MLDERQLAIAPIVQESVQHNARVDLPLPPNYHVLSNDYR